MVDKKPERFEEVDQLWKDEVEWVKMEDVLGLELLVKDVVKLNGKFGDYVAIRCEVVGMKVDYAFTTGGVAIVRKVMVAKEKGWLPLKGKITKEKRYYDIN